MRQILQFFYYIISSAQFSPSILSNPLLLDVSIPLPVLKNKNFLFLKPHFPKPTISTHNFQKSANTNTRTLISSKTRFSTSYLYG